MSEASAAEPAWTRRAYEATGLHPAWVGIGLASFGFVAFAAQEWAFGCLASPHSGEEIFADLSLTAIHLIILAYLVTACVVAERAGDRSLVQLRPLLDLTRAAPSLVRDARDRRVLWIAGGIGLLLNAGLLEFVSPGEVSLDPRDWNHENGWHRVLSFLMGFWSMRLVALMVRESRRLSTLAASIREIDLLDLDPLSLFARQGLTNALLIVGVVSVFALFLIDLAYLTLVGIILAVTIPVATVALLLPLRGARDRVAGEKQQELDWCRSRLRAARAALETGDGSEAGRVGELVAWESRVASVNEWPLDASAVQRFGLYLLIPLGSWAGAAFVERALDRLLE